MRRLPPFGCTPHRGAGFDRSRSPVAGEELALVEFVAKGVQDVILGINKTDRTLSRRRRSCRPHAESAEATGKTKIFCFSCVFRYDFWTDVIHMLKVE